MKASLAWRAAVWCAVAAGCASAGASDTGDPATRHGAIGIGNAVVDDVVRVGGFARVAALAASRTRVFVVGDGGIAIYDRLGQRWLTPVPLPFDVRRPARLALAAADPAVDALWVTLGARLWIVRPPTRFLTAVPLPAEARELLIDRVGRGAYVLADGWWIVSPSGAMSPMPAGQAPGRDDVIPRPDAQQILRETPGLQSLGALLTRDEQLRSWQLTAMARAPERGEVWAGTNGGGVFVVDPAFLRSTPLPYGLRARGATALALAADGVWIAEAPDAWSATDVAITFASEDLGTWRWLSPAPGALGVESMAVRGHQACLATTGGTLVVDLEDRRLPVRRLLELAHIGRQLVAWSTAGGCWIGGTTGAARIPWPVDSVRGPDLVVEGPATFAFGSSGDTVWAATQAGVRSYVGGRLARGGTSGSSHGSGAALPNALSGTVRGLALAGDGLALLTDRELWLTGGTSRMSVARRLDAPLERVGRIRRLVADDRTLWIGGSLGAVAFSLRDHRWRLVTLGDPATAFGRGAADEANVRDLALSPRVAWLATGAGIVRVVRGDDGMPR